MPMVRSGIALAVGIVACGSSGSLVPSPPDGAAGDGIAPADAASADVGSGGDARATDAGADADAAVDAAPPCGGLGERCCAGATCAATLACADGICGCATSSDCPAGGKCSSGRCIVTIASNQSAAYLLAVDETNVSWANWTTYSFSGQVSIAGSVVTASLDGGAPVTLYAGDIGEWWTGFASDAKTVYWNGGRVAGGIVATPLAGGPTRLLASLACWAMAVDDANVYCTSGSSGKIQTVTKVALSGSAPVTLNSSTQHSAMGIVVRAGTVYWNAGDVIESMSVSGGAPTTIASGVVSSDIAMNSTAVYWQTSTGIASAPLSGGTPTTVALSMPHVQQMTVDDDHVYWTDSTDGTVMKAPLGGGAATTLYAGDLPYAIAVDDTSVYWTSATGGTVMRLSPK
jgi:Domain of unknown function (DUF5050)